MGQGTSCLPTQHNEALLTLIWVAGLRREQQSECYVHIARARKSGLLFFADTHNNVCTLTLFPRSVCIRHALLSAALWRDAH